MRDAVALTKGPQAIWLGIVWGAFKEQDGATQEQRAGDEQRSHEPAQIGDPEHAAALIHIEEIGPVVGCLHAKASVREHGAFRASRGA